MDNIAIDESSIEDTYTASTENGNLEILPECEFNIQNEIPASHLDINTDGDGYFFVDNSGYISISQPLSRAHVNNNKVHSFFGGIKFRYNGHSDEDILLYSGGLRRQIGLKLKSKNTCNVLYVMWLIEPEEKLRVQIKSNPGMSENDECLAGNYSTPYEVINNFPPISSMNDGEYHTLTARLEPIEDENNGSRGDDFELTICVDGLEVLREKMFDIPNDVSGVSGFRTDNGNFDFKFYSDADKDDNSWFVSYSGKNYWSQLRFSNVSVNNMKLGDFNGDGKTDVFRTSNGKWYVSYGGNSTWTELRNSNVSLNNMKLGDFDGDGKTDVFRTSNGKWYVSYGGNSTWAELRNSNVSLNNMKLGDFNGDGKTDVFRTSNGKWYVSYGGNSTWTEWNTSNFTLNNLILGDFDGDNETDVFRATNG